MRLVDSKQIQEMDRYTIEKIGIPGIVLMENAARSWVEAVEEYLDEDRKIFIFCGSGNNGGDGYAIARNLANRISVSIPVPRIASTTMSSCWIVKSLSRNFSQDKVIP